MNTSKHDAAVHVDPSPSLRQWWSGIATLLVLAVFAQAVFAGLMLSGVEWGRTAHALNAGVLMASTLAAGLVSLVTLRRVPRGLKLGLTLLSLALVIILQAGVGKSAAQGANLMWVHIPLGVALVGLAGQAASVARRLGAE